MPVFSRDMIFRKYHVKHGPSQGTTKGRMDTQSNHPMELSFDIVLDQVLDFLALVKIEIFDSGKYTPM